MSKPSTSPSWRWLSETWWRISHSSPGLPGKMSVTRSPCSPSTQLAERRLEQLVERQPLGRQRRRQLDERRRSGGSAAPNGLRSARLVAEDRRQRVGADHLERRQHLARPSARGATAARAPSRRPARRRARSRAGAGRGTTRSSALVTTPNTPEVPTNSCLASRPVLFLRSAVIRSRTRAVRQHDLDAQQVLAHVAVAQQARAAGVRDDHAADRGVGAEVDREHQAVRLERGVELAHQHPAADGGRAVDGVDLQRLRQPLQAEHQHLARGVRRRGADQAGVGALREQSEPVLRGERQHARRPRRARGRTTASAVPLP